MTFKENISVCGTKDSVGTQFRKSSGFGTENGEKSSLNFKESSTPRQHFAQKPIRQKKTHKNVNHRTIKSATIPPSNDTQREEETRLPSWILLIAEIQL